MIKMYNINPELKIKKSVALVGNSNNLLLKKYGKLIDKFSEIIRFNFGDLDEDITGLKTTIRWINCPINIYSAEEHNREIKNKKILNKYCVELMRDVNIICWKSLVPNLKKCGLNNNKFYTPNEMCTFGNINKYLQKLGIINKFNIEDNCWPRTGFHAILTCIRSDNIPHIFGFDLEEKNEIRHYSMNAKYNVDKMTQHQVRNEIKILKEMENKGLIVVHR